ncbi:FecR family protein [Sphingobium cloacae]|uniref:Iron dicitrate transport regulator FecR n=1 Tax=Sphingobium cloacae TaxID=120107 RepID=A0A1E1F4B1_9SPHN|nr:FecR domain-containing protein [Sphingobium cloacae]BAV65355.1 hypothetical protein SCLO_1023150 [Sphingobium cloacae]
MASDRKRALLEAADWYTRIIEGDDPDLDGRFHDWLDADPLHAESWRDILRTGRSLARLEPTTSAQWVQGRAAPAGEARAAPPPRRRAGRRFSLSPSRLPFNGKRLLAGAAAACAVFAFAPDAIIWWQADQTSRAGEVRALALADGTKVDLGPASAIAIDYEGGRRNVRLLAGQAWFEVAHDPARPFRVESDNARVTVLGTGFDVRMTGGATDVSVAHGRVRLESLPDTKQTRELTAGEWASIAPDVRERHGAASVPLLGLWRRGELVARGETLGNVIEQIRPWYRGRILVLDSSLAAVPVTGIFKASDPLRAICNLVEPHGGRVATVTPWLIVVTKG